MDKTKEGYTWQLVCEPNITATTKAIADNPEIFGYKRPAQEGLVITQEDYQKLRNLKYWLSKQKQDGANIQWQEVIDRIFETSKFGTPKLDEVKITKDTIMDKLYEISHNEYGDAKSKYDLSLHEDRKLLVDAFMSVLREKGCI